MKANSADNPHELSNQGNHAYQAGFSRQAAELFRRGAEAALEQNDIHSHVHNLRWTGNSLMWAGQPNEAAQYLLRAISFDGQPEVDIEDVYAAMTDLCLLTLHHRSYAGLQRMLDETRSFLERRGLQRWGHRLDLTQANAHLRRGEYGLSYQMASRAWQNVRTTPDGPRYHNASYLNYLFRAALGLADLAALDSSLELIRRHAETDVQSARIRRRLCAAIRLAFDGISDANRESIDLLVQELIGVLATTEWARDETLDTFRLLGMLGRWEEAGNRLDQIGFAERSDVALLRLDLGICRLIQQTGRSLPFYSWNERTTSAAAMQLLVNRKPPTDARIHALVQVAEETAGREDTRMECSHHSQSVAIRRQWL